MTSVLKINLYGHIEECFVQFWKMKGKLDVGCDIFVKLMTNLYYKTKLYRVKLKDVWFNFEIMEGKLDYT